MRTKQEDQKAGAVWADKVAVDRRISQNRESRPFALINPFASHASRPWLEVARELGEGAGTGVLPGVEYYRERWQAGAFGPHDLAAASARAGVDADRLSSILEGGFDPAGEYAEPHDGPVDREAVIGVFQDALEDGYTGRLLGLLGRPIAPRARVRPAVQGMFCMDVRSERIRRRLEAITPEIETRGLAGSFGLALEWRGNTEPERRCPGLVNPTVAMKARLETRIGLARALGKGFHGVSERLRSWLSPAESRRGARENHVPFELVPDGQGSGIDLETRVELAAGILSNLGPRTGIARLVMLCGHESAGTSDPAVQCGACGGYGGGLNARIAAAILNEPETRSRLASRGGKIPDDVSFLAAVHDTGSDRITLLDVDQVPESHRPDLDRLRAWLRQASVGEPSAQGRERGLVGNAAFLAAPRRRSRGVDLDGRVFLHEYDWTTDLDDSSLSRILAGPMAVASWINLQYFATAAEMLGRVGETQQQRGLTLSGPSAREPRRSWHHEPLRLQVVVEAPLDRIERVLSLHSHVRDLVNHGWVRLFAIDPHADRPARWIPGEGWSSAGDVSSGAFDSIHVSAGQQSRS